MGEAILASLTQAVGADRVRVSDARAAAGEQVAARHQVRWCAETADAVAGAAVVIVAVKPQDVASVLGAARPMLDTAAVVVSVAAGIPTSFLEQHLDPGAAAVRVMPNTPATIGADRKSTRLNSSHVAISYAVFCLKKKKKHTHLTHASN